MTLAVSTVLVGWSKVTVVTRPDTVVVKAEVTVSVVLVAMDKDTVVTRPGEVVSIPTVTVETKVSVIGSMAGELVFVTVSISVVGTSGVMVVFL